MSLGVLTNIAAIYAENNLNQTQSSLQNTLNQLSSGSRINSGADDAAGLSVVNGLQANVSALTQSSQNASDGIGLLQTADGALSQVTNLLNRAVTLATESANGTLNSNHVSSANAEYQNILTEIGNIGSTTNFNGNSVFTATAKTVFVSDGTASGANSFSEVVGTLGKSGVGQAVGATILSLPTPTTPTATTTVQPAASVTTPLAVLVNPLPVAASATASASSTLTPVVTGSTAFSGNALIASGVQAGTGGAAYVASAVTAAPTSGSFSASDTYSGVVGVRLVTSGGASSLYTASVAPGSSLQTVVTSLNNSLGFNPNSGSPSTSGLQASIVNNALVITTAPGTLGQVSVDAPTNSLQVNPLGSGSLQNVSFGAAGGVTTTTSANASAQSSSSASAIVTLGTGLVQGSLVISSSTGSTLGTIDFGSTANGNASDGLSGIENALATTLGTGTAGSGVETYAPTTGALSGFSASLNTSTGALTISGPLNSGAAFQVNTSTAGSGVLQAGANTAITSATGVVGAFGTTPLAATSTTAAFAIGANAVSGTLNLLTAGGAAVGSLNFGTGTSGATAIGAAITSAFAAGGALQLGGFSATYSGGTLTVTGGSGFKVSTNASAGALTTSATPASGTNNISVSGSATTLGTTATAVANGTYTASSLTLGSSSPTVADTYSGTLTAQVAGSGQTYSATIAAGSSVTATLSALNAAFGSSIGSSNTTVGSIGASGLVAIATSSGAISIVSGPGAGQAVVDNASTFQVNAGGNTSFAAATVTGSTSISTGYTAKQSGTAATIATATVQLGTAAVAGSLNLYAGTTAQGTAIGTINFGITSGAGSVGGATGGAGSVEAALATAFTGASTSNANLNTVTYTGGAGSSLAGYAATYNTGTGALTVSGPANGNSFSLGQSTSGNAELQTGTVSTTLEAGPGVTAGAGTVYSGTINFGSNNTSYAITTPATAAALVTGTIANNTFLADVANAGLSVANNNGQLQFTSLSASATAPPAVSVTNGVSATEAYTAASVTFAPTTGTGASATFSGSFSIAENGTNFNTTFSNTTGNQALAILNGQSAGTGILGSSLTASLDATSGALVISGLPPTAPSGVAAAQISVNAGNNLSGVTSSTQTLSNTNASATTTYTGTISFGAVGTTAAGSYVIGSNGAGTTAAAIAQQLNSSGVLGNSATGIVASVNSLTNQLVFSGPTSGTAQAQGPNVTLTNVTATAPSQTTYSASTAAFASSADGTFSGNLSVGTLGSGQQSTVVAAGTTLTNLVTQLNNQYTQAGVSSQLSASAGTGTQAGQLIITSAIPTNATDATADQLVFSQATNANTLLATSASSTDGGPSAGVDFTATTISQLNAGSAQKVLAAVTTAINDVAYQRGLIGANVNQLTAASNVARSESVNLTAAQSNIQSTDYGSATSNLAKYQVLSQTGISALAQANSVQQEVLKLLQ